MKILYAEDEQQLSVAVTEILRMEGFAVTPVYDGGAALEAVNNDFYDALILDIMMPVMDGIEVLRKVRQSGNHVPVLMLTAKAALDDRVTGLSEGADDYLAKPFAMRELVARLRSLLRRQNDYRFAVIRCANIELDSNTGELKSDKGSLRLNNTEAELLAFFLRHPNAYFTAGQLAGHVWNGKESADKAELYVFYLKNKLRQIRSALNILVSGDSYALGESAP